MTQVELAAASGVSHATIKRLEAMDGELVANRATLAALQRALEEAGVVFIAKGDNAEGDEGVRLRSAG
ncbi:hypothetical protein GCM10011390_50180 [Aureimonas endophytica]|uniref:Helix-turn-helix protein n=2 Tax=Aureimonas endophytica TaxID=2027858 RepID=A0A917A3K7_9HYPH|nr:hypothetical protein GCM10011390_50180 [Aureimonas endophytica]